MNIFEKIKNAIYNPKYYSEVVAKPFSYSFKYLLIFALLFALAFTIVVTIRFIPIVKFLQEKIPQTVGYFPQELVISIKDGKASTNVQEPYFMKIPDDYYKSSHQKSPDGVYIENFAVINTKDKFDVNTFFSYKTAVLLTQDSFVYFDNGKISITPLSGIKDFTLNKDKVAGFANVIQPLIVLFYPIVFVGAYIGGFFVILFKMAYLLFGALLIWIIAKIKGIKMGYKKSYIAGMQLMTGAIIITSVLGAISPRLTFAFFFSILLIVSAFLNLRKEIAQSSAPVA